MLSTLNPEAPRFETLEPRVMLSATGDAYRPDLGDVEIVNVTPVVVAGDPSGTPADSPDDRVDPNTNLLPFGGVGSLFMDSGNGSGYLGTGTVIGDGRYILTAAHLVDINNNGTIDFAPSAVSFILNYGSDMSSVITAAAITIHPDYTGFNHPVVNDDVAIITLSQPVPSGVPIYPIYTGAPVAGDVLTVVGYGKSGDGVNGYTTDASFTVKRVGGNVADVFTANDEGGGTVEVFRADFDAPDGSNGFYGGASLGNDVETTLGPGDSGGPSFVTVNGDYMVYGIDTFSFSTFGGPSAPLFGSGWGGMVVSGYLGFIDNVLNPPPPAAETVDVLKASYNSSKGQLTVEAVSSLEGSTQLQARYLTSSGASEFKDMTYNSRKGKWSVTLPASTTPLTAEVRSSGGAIDSAPVTVVSGGGKGGKPNSSITAVYAAATPNSGHASQAALFAALWHSTDDKQDTPRNSDRHEQVVDLLSLLGVNNGLVG